jgi:hypothetical protein
MLNRAPNNSLEQELLIKALLGGKSISWIKIYFCPQMPVSSFYKKVTKLVNLRHRKRN